MLLHLKACENTTLNNMFLFQTSVSGFWTVFVVFLLPMCSVTQFLSPVDCFNLITWACTDGSWTNSVTGSVSSWQIQTTPIRLCWYHDADHQLSLSTQALILSLWSTCTYMNVWHQWRTTHHMLSRASMIHSSWVTERDSKLKLIII